MGNSEHLLIPHPFYAQLQSFLPLLCIFLKNNKRENTKSFLRDCDFMNKIASLKPISIFICYYLRRTEKISFRSPWSEIIDRVHIHWMIVIWNRATFECVLSFKLWQKSIFNHFFFFQWILCLFDKIFKVTYIYNIEICWKLHCYIWIIF